jgi:exopolysaccharide biosynthesis polyprenyl glycosylphosphotransferase
MLPITLQKQAARTSRWVMRPGERRVLLIFGDFVVGLLALFASLVIWAAADESLDLSVEFLSRTPAWFFLLPVIWILLLVETYDERRAGNFRETVLGVGTTALVGLGFYVIMYFSYPIPKLLPRRGVADFLLAAFFLTMTWRFLYIRIFTAKQFLRRVMLVGAGQSGRTILKIINETFPPPYVCVGIVDDDPEKIDTQIEGYSVLGNNEKLLKIIAEQGVTDIVVAISGEMHGRMFQALLDAQEVGVTITRFPVAYEEILARVPIQHLETDWILRSFVDQTRKTGFFELGKRLLDIIGGLVGVVVLLTMLPFISLAIFVETGRPILYFQTRLGRGGIPFKIIKFRTMCHDAEPDGQPQWAEENDKRATRVGRILRRTHIDELPQIINVLKGEMSLVGPRAERPEIVDHFQKHVPFYRARLLVKPGINGWAQIHFGYTTTIQETILKLEYDLFYIKHRNLLMDLIVLLRTPATMMGFRGR